MSYVPLHNHSAFSLADGISRIDDIMKRCKEIGVESFALTEHSNMMSFLKFFNACKENNIKPIIGCEIYLNEQYFTNKEKYLEEDNKRQEKKKKVKVSDEVVETDTEKIEDEAETERGDSTKESNSHLVIMAKNWEGVKNCLHLSNRGFFNFYRKPLLSEELVFQFMDKNNIVSSACLGSPFNKLIMENKIDEAKAIYSRYKEKFGDDFYIEFHLNEMAEQRQVNLINAKICKELNIKPVFALDSHYVQKEDWYIQYLLYAINKQKTINTMTLEDWFYKCRKLYIKTHDEIMKEIESEPDELHDILYDSVQNTKEVASKVEKFDIELYKDNYPKFCPTIEESEKLFNQKIIKGFKEKVASGLIPKEKIQIYKDRVKTELEVIKQKKVFDYFLINEDILNNFVPNTGGQGGTGRGSAPSSICLWLTNITKIDPIKYNLIFARFLNKARKDCADIDCLLDTTLVICNNNIKYIRDIKVNDLVLDVNNVWKKVLKVSPRIVKDNDVILQLTVENNGKIGKIIMNSEHKMFTNNKDFIKTKELTEESNLFGYVKTIDISKQFRIIKIEELDKNLLKGHILVDISVEDTKSFQIIPFSSNFQL